MLLSFTHPLASTVLLLSLLVGGSEWAEAAQCACANENVHLRTGPGTGYDIVTLLVGSHCLPHDGQSRVGGSYTWLHLDYHGRSTWAASNWLTVKTCAGDHNTPAPVSAGGGHTSGSGVQLSGCPHIVTRAQWGARAPKHAPGTMGALPVYVFIHHSGAGSQCFDQDSCARITRGAQNYYMDDPPNGHGWSDLGYNFMVGGDGNAYEVRGWDSVGAHTKGYNHNGIAICVIGDFTSAVPNSAALNTVRQLIQCGLDNGKISPHYTLKGHRDVGQTACPGTQLYNLIHSWPHYASGTQLYG